MRERRFSVREVIARSYPTWDHAMADRLIAWLDECGYQIIEKQYTGATQVPSAPDSEPSRPFREQIR